MQKLTGGVTIQPATEVGTNMAVLLWGPSGAGKTTLAATLPGRKLLVNFDPRGPASVAYRDDVDVADYSGSDKSIVEEFKRSNPFGLDSVMPNYDSIIVDSLTTVGDLTVAHGISITKGAMVERPSPGAYMARNALILQLVVNMLKLSERHGKHLCFIAHQGATQLDDDGKILSIPMYLGGQLPAQTSVRFSEVWALYDLQNVKWLGIRACRFREPMKSRMFDVSKTPEFKWNYDPNTDQGDTIASWHEQWLKGGKRKIAPPK